MQSNRSNRSKYILLGLLALLLVSLAVPAAARPLVVDASLLNVRSGPGTSYGALTQVSRGTVLTQVSEQGTWSRVILPGGSAGWVASQYTSVFQPNRYAIVDVSALNVRSGPGTNHPVQTRLSRNQAVPVLEERSSWLRVLLPQGGQGWMAGWHTSSANCQGYVIVTPNARLNMRSGPGTGHTVLDQLPRGEMVAVLGKQGNWFRIARLSGATGWIAESYTAPAGTQAPSPSPSPGNSPLAGKTIVLDPGHGGPDPGAVGITGYYEKTVNMAVANQLAPMLRDAGAKVLMTRWSDWNPTLWERVSMANSNSAHAFVSIHSNAHTQSWANGTETYYNSWNASSSRSRILAQQLQRELVSALGLRDIGVKTANFYVITNTHMPSALVEIGFLSNRHDESVLRQPQTHRRAAEALYRGLENFFR
jgi:N-acetylmuramoyl-L-alanine amidase